MHKKSTPGISDAEWKVMETLWASHPLTANEVIDSLCHSIKWSGNTVRTLLSRLVRKGALKTRKDGPRFLYSPAFERGHFVATESDSFLKRVFLGSAKPLLLHFAERTNLTPAEIAELKRLLDKKGDSK